MKTIDDPSGDRAVTEEAIQRLGWERLGQDNWPFYRSPNSQPVFGGPVCFLEWTPPLGCDGWTVNGHELIGPFETEAEVVAVMLALKIPCPAFEERIMNDTEPTVWLKELGATRPQAVASDVVFVIGEWFGGYYPIMYKLERHRAEINGAACWVESNQWWICGVPVDGDMPKSAVVRVMSMLKIPVPD